MKLVANNSTLTFKEIVWQRPYEIEDVERVLLALASTKPRGPVVFEARAINGRIRYFIGMMPNYLPTIKRIFTTLGRCYFYDTPLSIRTPITKAKALKLYSSRIALNTNNSDTVMRACISALAGVGANETGVVQVVLGQSFSPTTIERKPQDPNASWLDTILGTVKEATPSTLKSMQEKAGQFSFASEIRCGATGIYASVHTNAMASAICTLASSGSRMCAVDINPVDLNCVKIPSTLSWKMPLRLSIKEIIPLMLLPFGNEEITGAPTLHPKELMPPNWYRSPKYLNTARIYGGSIDGKRLSISPTDSREHTLIFGPTGCGKSTTMLNLIMQDINAERGVMVIDPKADLVNDVLARVPEERLKDVVVIDPSDANPVGWNPLIIHKGQNPSLVTDAILAVLQELFKDVWGIRSQDILNAGILTLAQTKDANLMWVLALLTDENFRKKIVSTLKDDIALKPFWRQYDAMRDSERRTMIESSLNKFRQLLYRPSIRNILGQSHPKFDLIDLFTERKIVLVPLNKGLVGSDTARLLGSLLVGMTWTLALTRANIPAEKRHTVCMYIDELQDYLSLPTSFSDALAQARGLGLAITVAHQYRGQLSPDIKQGIDANCKNKIIFGLNNPDAREMATHSNVLEDEDFITLPRYTTYSNILVNGRQTGWMYGKTFPPPNAIRLPAEAKAISQKMYGIPAEEVENELIKILVTDEQAKQEEENKVKSTPLTVGKRRI